MSPPLRQSDVAQRRQTLRLPKRRRHIAAALVVLAIVIGTPILAMQIMGRVDDASASGTVAMPHVPVEPTVAGLDREDGTLPDLLAGSVAIGDNPTDAVEPPTDALGNPTVTVGQRPRPQPVVERELFDPNVVASLTRQSKFGPIPGRSPDDRTAFKTYGKTAPVRSGQSVSLIIGGLGINGSLTQRAINELPAEVTLSFAAHSTNLQDWIDRAHRAGHEVLLEVPMEGLSFSPDEPGANRTLRTDGTTQTNTDNLHAMMARAYGYAGVINYKGERYLNRADAAAAFMAEMNASGLGFITDGSFDTPTLPALATSVSVPYKAGFGLIDPTNDRAIIDNRLQDLSAAAAGSGTPIGIGFVYPETLDAVKGWAATLSSDGLVLVPATSSLK